MNSGMKQLNPVKQNKRESETAGRGESVREKQALDLHSGSRGKQQKALFLDRDGTINIDKHYLWKVEEFQFREGIFQLVNEFYSNGYLIFVITNQAGIAKRLYSEDDLQVLHRWMIAGFRKRGIHITDIRFCPHHPEFTGHCECRKPRPGMILDLAEKYDVDLEASVLIGDKMSDIEAGLNAGVGTNWLVKKTGKISSDNVTVYTSGNKTNQ